MNNMINGQTNMNLSVTLRKSFSIMRHGDLSYFYVKYHSQQRVICLYKVLHNQQNWTEELNKGLFLEKRRWIIE